MKHINRTKRRRFLPVARLLAAVTLACGASRAEEPPGDGPLTRGHMREVVLGACDAMDAHLPNRQGNLNPPHKGYPDPSAAYKLHLFTQQLRAGAREEDAEKKDAALVTVGELKHAARLVYDRLAEAGYRWKPLRTGQNYPWDGDSKYGDDTAQATVAQLTFLFSFDIITDKDGNDLPDWWEMQYFGRIGLKPEDPAPSGIGMTLERCYSTIANPVTFEPHVTITDGGGQTGPPDRILGEPIVIVVKDAKGNPIADAPVFCEADHGQFFTTSYYPSNGKTTTDYKGQAVMEFKMPATPNTKCKITISSGEGKNKSNASMEVTTDDGKAKEDDGKENDVNMTLNDDGSVDATWSDNSKHPNGTLIKIKMPDGTWKKFMAPAGAYKLHIPAE